MLVSNREANPSRAWGRGIAAALALCLAGMAPMAAAQQPPASQQQAPPEAGGPTPDAGPMVIPKKKPSEEPPPPARPQPPQKIKGMPEYSLRVNVPEVEVDVNVITKDGMFVPGLKKDHFRILEDGVPQQVKGFSVQQAPITAVLLVEFAANSYGFIYDALNASYAFANSLKKDDWIAVVSYDMRPHIVVDFTQNKQAVYGALHSLQIPTFRETNLFDALFDTIDRVEGIEGRKYIIVVGNGLDTFSKLTYDKILKKVQETQDVTIFTISTGQAYLNWLDTHGYIGPISRLDFLQADNQMATFARMTGGRWYHPMFTGQFPEIFADIGQMIRNQYVLTYTSTNAKQDGSWRKVKVELVDPQTGKMLKVVNEKGKELKYQIIAKDGYRARHEVE